MKHRRLIPPLMALGLVPLAASPAAAAEPPIAAAGSFARTIPFIDGELYAYECTASAPGAVSTSITSCQLTSRFGTVGAAPTTSQGAAAETAAAVSWDTTTNKLCWTASARYIDGSTQSTSGCSSVSDTAGAGAS
jgi:hypothetical protein